MFFGENVLVEKKIFLDAPQQLFSFVNEVPDLLKLIMDAVW